MSYTDKVAMRDHVKGIRKLAPEQLIDFTEYITVGNKQVPIIHKQNKPKPELIYHKQSLLNKLAAKLATKYLTPYQKQAFALFHAETSKVTVQKYKDRHVAGYSQEAVAELQHKGFNIHQIFDKIGIAPFEILMSHARPNAPLNVMLNEGINQIFDLVDNTSTAAADHYDNTNADIGTGTSTTAAAATDTELIAGAVYKDMDGGFPTSASQKINFKGTFGTADANQAWEEFSVRNSNATPKNLCRIVTSKGTKVSGETWTLEIEITGS